METHSTRPKFFHKEPQKQLTITGKEYKHEVHVCSEEQIICMEASGPIIVEIGYIDGYNREIDDVRIYEAVVVDNPNYDEQLKIYNKLFDDYQVKLEDWNKKHTQEMQELKAAQESKDKELYLKLKARFENETR